MCKTLLISSILIVFSGCTAPVKVMESNRKTVIQSITYIRDNRPAKPICYAIISSRASGYANAVTSISAVPCEDVKNLIEK